MHMRYDMDILLLVFMYSTTTKYKNTFNKNINYIYKGIAFFLLFVALLQPIPAKQKLFNDL